MKDFLAGLQSFLRMDQTSPALEGAAKLAARDDFLAGIATLLEVHAAHRFVIEHLWHKSIDDRRRDGGNRAAHFAPQPELRGERGKSGKCLPDRGDPQRPRLAVGRVEVHKAGRAQPCQGPRRLQRLQALDRIAGQAPQFEIGGRVAEPGLGPQHEHRKPLERGRQDVQAAHQHDGGGALPETHEARLHAALGRAESGQARLRIVQQDEILRQLPLEKAGGVVALDTDDAQVGQCGGAVQEMAHG